MCRGGLNRALGRRTPDREFDDPMACVNFVNFTPGFGRRGATAHAADGVLGQSRSLHPPAAGDRGGYHSPHFYRSTHSKSQRIPVVSADSP